MRARAGPRIASRGLQRREVFRAEGQGEIVRVEVDGWGSSIRLRTQDRLHVEVASTAFPGYARNLGTLEPIATAEMIVVATNRILHDAEHPSHVRLPVLPREGALRLGFER